MSGAATRLRVGVIGAGRRGSEHIPSVLALPHLLDLVAVCDVSSAVAQKAAAQAEALTSLAVARGGEDDVTALVAHYHVPS